MAGRMGSDTVTVKNLIVVDLKPEENLLAVSGPVPGISGGLLSLIKLAEGNLEELVEEAPQVEVQEVEEEGKSDEKLASTRRKKNNYG
ncbi:MAG: 50S ribosomal protein L3 [Candidatus Woesebacteria bacterium GW2011_GWB1_39_12]|uniref:50S ribosomal protein L3 n=1 Tax=Candidatus Woesebacteria bacterium GW2011_GWB1_39_12 TaxID=1618574 RepID=A0A0G0PIB2_9BACT|nr:MAG: 50S ribosomal protein L3 [Candidatus Woesebacteria bacterium GW2011_GWB1_39_12]